VLDLSNLDTGEWISLLLIAAVVSAAIAYVLFGEDEP
jgi:hypothetical protein